MILITIIIGMMCYYSQEIFSVVSTISTTVLECYYLDTKHFVLCLTACTVACGIGYFFLMSMPNFFQLHNSGLELTKTLDDHNREVDSDESQDDETQKNE